MTDQAIQLHGTCVALGSVAAFLQGPPGSGKSDLALRFVMETPPEEGAMLVADDRVCILAAESGLIASAPPVLAGKIEVRGIGILDILYRQDAELKLAVQLVERKLVPRMPPDPLPMIRLANVEIPLLRLYPFDASAPLKLRLALRAIG